MPLRWRAELLSARWHDHRAACAFEAPKGRSAPIWLRALSRRLLARAEAKLKGRVKTADVRQWSFQGIVEAAFIDVDAAEDLQSLAYVVGSLGRRLMTYYSARSGRGCAIAPCMCHVFATEIGISLTPREGATL